MKEIKKINAIEAELKDESTDKLMKLKIHHDTEADLLKQTFAVIAILAFGATVFKALLDSITIDNPGGYFTVIALFLVCLGIIGIYYAKALRNHVLRAKVIDWLIEKKKAQEVVPQEENV